MNQRRLVTWLVLGSVSLAVLANAQPGNKKLAQTGMKFLNVGMGARQAGMADAFTAAEGNALSMFYNTAGMARLTSFAEVALGHVQWIADIKHFYGAVALSPFDGDYGVVGFTVQTVDYGEVEATIRANNAQGYLDVGTFKPNAYAFGIGYARALSDKFSVGGNVKFVYQNLGSGIVGVTYSQGSDGQDSLYTPTREIKSTLDVPAFDFGMLYRTGLESLTLGVSIRNFAREVSYIQESFQLPLIFKIGVSMNVLDVFAMDPASHSLMLAVDAEHPRDYPEQIKVGAEYVFSQTLSLRFGYVSPADEHGVSFGVGLQQSLVGTHLKVDYAYTPFGIFSSVQRLSLNFSL
ncbi:MAG: PorV/PorQ family protein [Ignavibacteriales bacterium]|nr:PorV/PorQ family protein [Ignavibacteriales bacterium]